MTCLETRVSTSGSCVRIHPQPLLFDHIQKSPVVQYPVKNRTQSERIVSAERVGEIDDWCTALGVSRDSKIHGFVFSAFDSTRILDVRVETRKGVAIGWCSGVACLVYD